MYENKELISQKKNSNFYLMIYLVQTNFHLKKIPNWYPHKTFTSNKFLSHKNFKLVFHDKYIQNNFCLIKNPKPCTLNPNLPYLLNAYLSIYVDFSHLVYHFSHYICLTVVCHVCPHIRNLNRIFNKLLMEDKFITGYWFGFFFRRKLA